MEQEEYNSTTAKKTLGNYKTLSLRYKTLLLFSPDERNKIPVSLTTPKEDIFIKENRCLSRITKGDRGFSGSGCWMVQESRILPWTVITELAATGAAACAAKLRGKVLGGNLLQEFCLITPTQNIDFVDLNSENSQPPNRSRACGEGVNYGNGIQEFPHNAEGTGEAPRGIDDIQFTQPNIRISSRSGKAEMVGNSCTSPGSSFARLP